MLGINEWDEVELYMLSVSPNKGLGSLLEEASFKLLDPSYHYYAVRSLYLQSKFSVGLSTGLRQDLLDFDQALGFPGEG